MYYYLRPVLFTESSMPLTGDELGDESSIPLTGDGGESPSAATIENPRI